MTTYSRKRSIPASFSLPSPPPTSSPPPSPHSFIVSNTKIRPRVPPISKTTRLAKKRRLTQLTLDLGGNPQKTCKGCGMEYVPSNAEDAMLHKRFHESKLRRVDVEVGKGKEVLEGGSVVGRFVRRARNNLEGGKRAGEGEGEKRRKLGEGMGMDIVIEVGTRSERAVRRLAERVLQVVEEELGAVKTEEEDLWGFRGSAMRKGSMGDLQTTTEKVQTQANADAKVDRHKIYLYIQDAKCIGLCLAERIHSAYAVLPSSSPLPPPASSPSLPPPSSPATTTATTSPPIIINRTSPLPALLGISRIWVSKSFRGAGIANTLLNTARRNFVKVEEVAKEMCAFSQPTESGRALAKRWFGKGEGWLVYDGRG